MSLFPGVAFITGAGSGKRSAVHSYKIANKSTGIGRQTAITFAVEGCLKIAIADQDPSALDETKKLVLDKSPHVDALIIPMDVRLDKDVATGIAATIDHFKRIDYAVNCAGKILYRL